MKFIQQLFILTTLISTTIAIYEEQLGSFDWHQQHIGLVNDAVFNNKGIRAYVTTEQGTLTSIYLKDGSITWRKIVDQNLEQLQQLKIGQAPIIRPFESSQRAQIAHVDGICEKVSVWDMQSGELVFDSRLQGGGCGAADVAWVGSRYLAILGDGLLSLLRGKDGSLLWQTEQLFESGEFDVARIFSTEDTITLLLTKIGSTQLKIVQIGVSDGDTTNSKTVTLTEEVGTKFVLTDVSCLYLSPSLDKVCSIGITDGAFQGCSAIPDGDNLFLRTIDEASEFAVEVQGKEKSYVEIFGISEGKIQSMMKYEFISTISSSFGVWRGSDDPEGYLAIAKQTGNTLSYDIIQTSDAKIIKTETNINISNLQDSYGNIPSLKSVYLATFNSKSGSVGVRLVCVFSDWSLAFIQQDSLVWKREEALAGITKAKFVPLPPPTKELEQQYRQNAPGLQAQLKAQFFAVKQSLTLAQPHEIEELESLRQQLSDKRLPWRDTNGFRKLIIAPTKSGKLIAIHNGNGSPLWSVNFGADRSPSHVEIWRNSHDPAQDILVMILLPPTANTGTTLVLLDAYDGSEVWKEDLNYEVKFVLPMKQNLIQGKLEQNLFLFIERNKKQLTAYVHPRQEAAAVLMNEIIPDTFFWSVNKFQNSIQGFGFSRNPESVSLSYDVVQTWRMVFPNVILAAVGKETGNQADPLYSQVKILGDRSLLFKYHNDNLLMVATGIPDGTATSGFMDASDIVLSIQFIDSVSGKIVYRQDHPGARGPVHAVLSEHWAVYHYWSVLNEGWQITVVELYEDVERPVDLLDLLLGKSVISYNDSCTSFDQPPLKALTQTFFTTLPVKTLAVTQTLAGLSVKNILMASYGDQIYAMDKRLLDPRRPKLEPGQKPTTEQMMEGLRPFSAYLPLASTSYATYNKRVLGLRGMVTTSSGLESTSLLFSYGLDLFYTRLMPSKGFDTLDEYFSYALLVLAMVGLLVGAVLVRWMHNQNKLKQKWK